MRTCIKLFSTLLLSLSLYFATAQDTNPVQFTFKAIRNDSGKAILHISALLKPGAQILSAKPVTTEDPFVSAVEFDSNSIKYTVDSLVEKGNLQINTDAAAGGALIRYYTDSVTWSQPLKIAPNDSAVIKGEIILAKFSCKHRVSKITT